MMKAKFLTKAKLIAVNERAKKAGGNHIDPGVVAVLPERFRFPVCLALPGPLERGWVRCWVTVGLDDPVVEKNVQTLLVDMHGDVFERLPCLDH